MALAELRTDNLIQSLPSFENVFFIIQHMGKIINRFLAEIGQKPPGKQKKNGTSFEAPLKRRRRDSNPRDAFDAYAISSRAPSTKLGDFSIAVYNHSKVAGITAQRMIL